MRSSSRTGVVSSREGVALWDTIAITARLGLSMLLIVLACLLIRASLVENFFIPSSSMVPTLRKHDHVVVSKLSYGLWLPGANEQVLSWSAPARGEVVVFTREDDPATRVDESARAMVKRVVGVGGDTVSIVGKQVFVNGSPVDEPYARWIADDTSQDKSFCVPAGNLFLLGDNRNESFDSRFWNVPFVKQSRVVGPVAVVY